MNVNKTGEGSTKVRTKKTGRCNKEVGHSSHSSQEPEEYSDISDAPVVVDTKSVCPPSQLISGHPVVRQDVQPNATV